MQKNYPACRNLFANLYASEMAQNPNPTNAGIKRNSSALQSTKKGGKSGRGGKGGGGSGRMPVAGDFDKDELRAAARGAKMKVHVPRTAPAISNSTYRKLADVERFALKQLRDERDAKEAKLSHDANAKLHAQVASLKTQVAKLLTARHGGGDSSDCDSEDLFGDSDEKLYDKELPPKKKCPHDNRGHRALDGPGRQGRSPRR
jgi:hypothetical protein